jgi:hypothetical protein
MLDIIVTFLAVSLGFMAGYFACRYNLLEKIGNKFMPTHPTKAKRLGRKAHNEVEEAEQELYAADNELKPMYGGKMEGAPFKLTKARLHISLARRILTTLLGQGFDEDENGNNGNGNGHEA